MMPRRKTLPSSLMLLAELRREVNELLEHWEKTRKAHAEMKKHLEWCDSKEGWGRHNDGRLMDMEKLLRHYWLNRLSHRSVRDYLDFPEGIDPETDDEELLYKLEADLLPEIERNIKDLDSPPARAGGTTTENGPGADLNRSDKWCVDTLRKAGHRMKQAYMKGLARSHRVARIADTPGTSKVGESLAKLRRHKILDHNADGFGLPEWADADAGTDRKRSR